MKAVVFYENGGVEKLTYTDVEKPEISPYEVLVKVKACALNHLDIWVRQGLPGVDIPMPHILGSDVAGVVLEAGKSVKRFKKEDRVIVSPGQTPVENWEAVSGRDSFSSQFQILGLQSQGGYAEKVAVDQRFVIPVSDRYSFEEWASVPLASLTAYHMLVG